MPGGSAVTWPMIAASGAERVRAQRRERPVRLGAVHHGDEAALARDVHGVDAEQLAGAAHLGPHRDVVLADEHADVGRLGDLVEYGGDAASGRVAERADPVGRGQQAGHQPVQRGGVRLDVRLDVQLAAGQHDRDAVVADRAGHDDRVSRPGQRDPELGRILGDQADSGRVDVAAVGLALLHHLGVAGDDLDAGRRGGRLHRLGDADQVGDSEALLEDEPGRQVQRGGAGHRQVVDGAVDGEVADVAAGEEQRRDDVGIGGEREPGAGDVQPGRVLELLEPGVAERVEEHGLDQGLGRLAARAVRHRDALFPHLGPTAAGPVDAVEHLLLAVGRAAAGGRCQRGRAAPARPAPRARAAPPPPSRPGRRRPESRPRRRSSADHLQRLGDPVAVHPAEVVVGGAGAFR